MTREEITALIDERIKLHTSATPVPKPRKPASSDVCTVQYAQSVATLTNQNRKSELIQHLDARGMYLSPSMIGDDALALARRLRPHDLGDALPAAEWQPFLDQTR